MKHKITRYDKKIMIDGQIIEPFGKHYLDGGKSAVEYRDTQKSGPHVVWYEDGENYSHHVYLPRDGEYTIGPRNNHDRESKPIVYQPKTEDGALRSLLRRHNVDLRNLVELKPEQSIELISTWTDTSMSWIDKGPCFQIKYLKMIHPDGIERTYLEKIVVWPGFNLSQIEMSLKYALP